MDAVQEAHTMSRAPMSIQIDERPGCKRSNSYSSRPICTADETSWRLCPTGVTTWAKRDCENISISTSGNEEECFTVMAYGKATRVERTLIKDVARYHVDHSESRWVTRETHARHLKQLSEDASGKAIHLLLDITQSIYSRSHENWPNSWESHAFHSGGNDRRVPTPWSGRLGIPQILARKSFIRPPIEEQKCRIRKPEAVRVWVDCPKGIFP
jgi:hypothetical protein